MAPSSGRWRSCAVSSSRRRARQAGRNSTATSRPLARARAAAPGRARAPPGAPRRSRRPRSAPAPRSSRGVQHPARPAAAAGGGSVGAAVGAGGGPRRSTTVGAAAGRTGATGASLALRARANRLAAKHDEREQEAGQTAQHPVPHEWPPEHAGASARGVDREHGRASRVWEPGARQRGQHDEDLLRDALCVDRRRLIDRDLDESRAVPRVRVHRAREPTARPVEGVGDVVEHGRAADERSDGCGGRIELRSCRPQRRPDDDRRGCPVRGCGGERQEHAGERASHEACQKDSSRPRECGHGGDHTARSGPRTIGHHC